MSSRRRTLTRRQFLAQSSAVGVALTSVASATTLARGGVQEVSTQQAATGLASLQEVFLHPAFSTRPMTRWWWFGGAVTREEITRELTLMRDAGLRGVELQPVYPVEVDDPARGIRNTRYFSPEWFELLRHTVVETRRLGMQLDFTPGSGWPYGGPFIPVDLAARRLQVVVKDAVGPRELDWDLGLVFPDEARLLATVAVPILPSQQTDVARARVIPQSQMREWKVPPGPWRIMTFIDAPTLMQVKRATPGMEGYVLDHFNQQAIELFLESVGNRTLEAFQAPGLPPFHSIFCDSLEVEGADWTGNLLEEFEQRRGYDLTPYLPALWQDAGPLTPHVRYDFHLTLSELILNHFFLPLAEWSVKQGLSARIQAHGAMGDVMRAYGLAHIPEGEHIGGGDHYLVDIAHRRLASSAGHIYEKRVVSAETYTWLRVPLFMVTLEMMKAATDAQFLDGINQIVNHGYPSSPPQAGRPGWTFYASTVVNHNNLWWRHYPQLAQYIQRAAGVLQQGDAVNPIAVYLPLADVYARFGAGGLHMDEELERHLGTELVLGLRRAGYDFDFLNDDAVQTIAQVQDGRLVAGTGAYSAVIVPEGQYMPPESLERLAEFVQAGGFMMFVKRVPDTAPGLTDQEARTKRLRTAFDDLWGKAAPRRGEVLSSGRGKVCKASDITDALAHLKEQMTPDFQIVEAGDNSEAARKMAIENVGFVHRRLTSLDLYFVSNVSEGAQNLRVRFAAGRKAPQRWDPQTGSVRESLVYQFVDLPGGQGPATEVQLELEAFESCFIVFPAIERTPLVTRTDWPGPLKIERSGEEIQVSGLLPAKGEYTLTDADGKTHRFSIQDLPEPLALAGPWNVAFDDGVTLTLPELRSWTEIPERSAFSGWATYETEFTVEAWDKDIEWALDLGGVRETAEVALNGVALGIAWKGLRRVSSRDALEPGSNHLKVEVANLWINHVESQPKRDLKPLAETYGIRWGTDEENLKPPLPPSGLLGPVRLVPSKRWTEKI